MNLDCAQVSSVLAGIDYPARSWEILTWAEFNGAGRVIMDVLHHVPEGSYAGPEEIVAAIGIYGELVAARTDRARGPRRRKRGRNLEAA